MATLPKYWVKYGKVKNLNGVDWEYAAATWAGWRSDSCDGHVLAQQSAERLQLMNAEAYIWQEGTDGGPVAPRDFALYSTPGTDRPIVVALKERKRKRERGRGSEETGVQPSQNELVGSPVLAFVVQEAVFAMLMGWDEWLS